MANPSPANQTSNNAEIEAEIARLSRRSFATGAIAALTGMSTLGWIATRPSDDGQPWPLRRMLEFNEQVARRFFSNDHRAPEFPIEQAVEPRVNGRVGLHSTIQPHDWSIQVRGQVDRVIPLAAIRALPAQTMTTEFKCVEGWSRIVSWKGVSLADFLAKFGVPSDYVGMSTPPDGVDSDGTPDVYQVGLDRASAMHPQTLLCYEMNGQPLTPDHGAPLRLVSAVKYGYKSIKRIGVIELSDRRPADYWAQRGYDWYGGL